MHRAVAAAATTPGGRASATPAGAARSGTPGSWNQRTDRPNRWVWSIVCGAPTSRSSGGRSAVSTSIGTSDSPASTTAGWKFAAAVPLVHSSTAGVPARPSPRATNAATRSSCTTCTRQLRPRRRGPAPSGVLRDPGATTAWRTPRATTRRRAWRRTSPGRRPARRRHAATIRRGSSDGSAVLGVGRRSDRPTGLDGSAGRDGVRRWLRHRLAAVRQTRRSGP